MDPELLQHAIKAAQKGQKYAFATVTEATLKGTPQKSGAKMLVLDDGTIYGTIGGGRYEKDATKQCLKAIKSGKTATKTYDYFGQKGQSVCGGQIKVFIEPFTGQKHFILCGAGHIGLPLSALAKMCNFRLSVIDNRRSFANKKRIPHADKLMVGKYAAQLKKCQIDRDTYIMIVTQGNEYDFECLKTVARSDAAYIGVISSQAKKVKFLKRLKKAKVPQKYLKRIKIPAGLDIGALSPAEIAISIMSEVLKVANKAHLGTSKFKAKRGA